MPLGRSAIPALIPLAMVPVVIGLTAGDRIGSAFGLSGDFWTGALMGSGIGLLFLMIVLQLRAKRLS